MARLRTLEHLDGKQVKFSTITSQYPELFVQRKRNTGELIITTDTDERYGMHHIYAGGEHIASGYGFATVKTRNDLTYIAETYTGIFNYFNQAYTYHNNAYSALKSYVLSSYAYTTQSILDNSYKNTLVHPDYNKIITENATYIFSFNNGQLKVEGDVYKSIVFNDENIKIINKQKYYNLQKTFVSFITGNASIYRKDISGTKYAMVSLNIDFLNQDKETSNIQFKVYTSDKNLNIIDNGAQWTYSNFSDRINAALKVSNKIIFPIVYNIDTDIYGEIYKVDKNNEIIALDDTSNHINDIIHFKWINPIIYGSSKTMGYTDIIDYNNINHLNSYLFNFSYETLLNNFQISTGLNTSLPNIDNYSYTYICIPIKDTNINPKFYISNDLLNKENNEGGLLSYNIDIPYSNETISSENCKVFQSYYTTYITESHNISTILRYDIDFK